MNVFRVPYMVHRVELAFETCKPRDYALFVTPSHCTFFP